VTFAPHRFSGVSVGHRELSGQCKISQTAI